jgi:alpha-ribazole phosphatase
MGTSYHVDLFLVRHLITDWNQEQKYLGHTDRDIIKSKLPRLSELKKELARIEFGQVYTSDLRRCRSTLAYLNIPGQVTIDSRLREIHFGDWEGKTYNDLKDEKVYQNWLDKWEDNPIPNGECANTFRARIDSFLDELFQQIGSGSMSNKQILLMTHGGVIRYLVSKYVPSKSIWEVSVPHGQGIILTLNQKGGAWICGSLSAVPFQGKES